MNENEPVPIAGRPIAPDELGEIARQHFEVLTNRMDEMGYASPSWTEIIALAAEEYEEIQTCTKVIRRDGLILEDGKENPASKIRSAAKQRYRMNLQTLGLTPADASKVVAKKKETVKESKWAI